MKNIRVASVQFQHVPGDTVANLSRITHYVRQASAADVSVIIFPECCISGYWHLRHLSREALTALAEPVFDGPSCQQLRDLSKEYNMAIGAGLIEQTPDGELYNTYVVALPDGTCHRHRKIHAFISEHVSCGSEITVFDTPWDCRFGVLICYDNNIVENVRLTALQGADVLLAPHQTGGCASVSPHAMGLVDAALWDKRLDNPEAIEAELRGPKGREWLLRWLPARAHDNGMFLVFSNGVGPDDDEIRTGNSMILDPYGRILTETCKAGDDMVVADLDASLLDECTGRRWNRTRRPDLYTPLTVPTGSEVDTRTSRFDKKGV
jgi:predicted amidohydrolase